MDSEQLFAAMRRFATTMARQFAINDVLYELIDHATSILAASGAGVSVLNADDELRFLTATSERITSVERVQDKYQAGACVDAFRTGEVVAVSTPEDAAKRWSHYGTALEAAGLGAVVSFPLSVENRRIGALDVYDEPRRWSPDDIAATEVLAEIASAYLLHAGRLAEARQLSTQLEEALDSRVVIEQAKGMLSRDHSVSVDEAFETMRAYSRSTRSPLRDVAERIVVDHLRLPPSD